MKKIIIRTKGGKGIGYGHFYRCLSLAKAMRNISPKVELIFIINSELASLLEEDDFQYVIKESFEEDIEYISDIRPGLFIFDSYLASNDYLKSIKKHSKLMLIDDNNDIYNSEIADIVYNGNLHAKKLGYQQIDGQIRLLGPKYLIMKEEYWIENSLSQANRKEGILITTGGTDDFEIALELLKILQKSDMEEKIKVVIGPGYQQDYIDKIEDTRDDRLELIYRPKSLKEYLLAAKIVITAGGSTVYEVLSQKSHPIVFSLADNQDLICRELAEYGIASLGKYPHIDYSSLATSINEIDFEKSNTDQELYNLIDGKGVLRLAEILVNEI